MGIAVAADPPKPAPAPVVPPAPTILHLTETADRKVPRDEFVADLAVEAADADPRKLQSTINQTMNGALAKAKESKGVSVETASYAARRQTGDAAPNWQGSQILHLASRDSASLVALVGTLQEQGLVVKRLAAQLSRETVRTLRDELTDEAIRHLKLRADRIAQTLDAGVTRYDELRVETDGLAGSVVQNFAPATGSLSSVQSPAPVMEPGDATVSITLAAAVELIPRHP
jgi:predicted secreted protein